MSHPFGDLLTQHLHRKHGLSQSRLAAGILQSPSVITDMSQGKRLRGPQARERVTAVIAWLQEQGALTTLDEANALLSAASMAPLQEQDAAEAMLLRKLSIQAQPRPSLGAAPATTLPRHNLSPQLTPFVGRSEQIAQLVGQMQRHRLLTLTGAGGVGKTRLALEVAAQVVERFADGVWFVDLAPLADPDAALQRILDLFGVPEQSARSRLALVTDALRTRQVLLVLDNCEHLIAACAELAETLLQRCPQVALLATSREALNIGGELPWRVPSLTHPPASQRWERVATLAQPLLAPDALLQFEAVALFVERAQARSPGFVLSASNAAAVAHICHRLDGIPLAIEMAAARVPVFTVEELAMQLDGAFDRRFQLLTSGARTSPLRQQTLRATLAWSYGLLTPAEQRLLVRLSVFTGGWTAASATAAAGATLDLLAQLVEKSLVLADQQDGQTRYRLLETVRQFAAEQGATEEQAYRQAQAQHSRYYLALLAGQEQRLQGSQQRTALDVLRTDFENIRAAWHWAVEERDFALLAQATNALYLYCEIRGHFREGVSLFAAVAAELAAAASATNPVDLHPFLQQVLARLGACEALLTNHKSAARHLEQALGFVTTDWERAFILAYLGWATIGRGELPAGRALLCQSLALSWGCQDPGLAALGLFFLANSAPEYTEAVHVCEESLTLWRQVGRPDRIAFVLGWVAWHTCCLGDYAQASAYWLESIPIYTALGMQSALAWALDSLGFVAWCQGDLPTAQRYLQEAVELYRTMGVPSGVGMCLAELALVSQAGGASEQAVVLARQAVAILRDTENLKMLIVSLYALGAALISAGDFAPARQVLSEALQRALAAQLPHFVANACYYFAELLVLESHGADLPLALTHKGLAVALLSCVRSQPATWRVYRDKADHLLAEIVDALPAELRTGAIARGQNCTLEEMAGALPGVSAMQPATPGLA